MSTTRAVGSHWGLEVKREIEMGSVFKGVQGLNHGIFVKTLCGTLTWMRLSDRCQFQSSFARLWNVGM